MAVVKVVFGGLGGFLQRQLPALLPDLSCSLTQQCYENISVYTAIPFVFSEIITIFR